MQRFDIERHRQLVFLHLLDDPQIMRADTARHFEELGFFQHLVDHVEFPLDDILRLVNGNLSNLPKFLTENGGLNSGMMIAQYTAASLVSENKVLAHPASVDSIPTSASQEDHNSMGSVAAHKLLQVLKNVRAVLGIELMVAAQGLDMARPHPKSGKPMRSGKGVEAAQRAVRDRVPRLREDRVLAGDIAEAASLLENGSLLASVERSAGKLK